MDETLNQIRLDAIDASDEVAAAIENGDDARQIAAGNLVMEVARRYSEALAAVPEAERAAVERAVGRRVTDLRRAAAQLARRDSGSAVASAVDAGQPFVERRAPGRSFELQRGYPRRDGGAFHVGGEVEAWCGKCRTHTEHHIVALVSGEPKQVICQACNSRHGYRTEPAPGRGGASATADGAPAAGSGGAKRVQTPEEREASRRAEEKRALVKELDAVAEPRRFDPKGRYKVGEVIFHVEHGRGKIENVLKGSLLVRFRHGLRPLNLF
jgi:hypothetical protein